MENPSTVDIGDGLKREEEEKKATLLLY